MAGALFVSRSRLARLFSVKRRQEDSLMVARAWKFTDASIMRDAVLIAGYRRSAQSIHMKVLCIYTPLKFEP